MTNIMDKIDHAIGLAKRIQNELGSGHFDDALYLTDTFVFLFSGHQTATRELVTSYTAVSQELLNEGKVEQAEALILKGLIIDPQNSQMLSILVEIKKTQHKELKELGRPSLAEPFLSHGYPLDVKRIAREFTQLNFPEELPFFDLTWRVFKNIQPEDFKEEAVSGALGIVGTETSHFRTPKVIVLLNKIYSEDKDMLRDEEVREALIEIGRAIGCSRELADKIIDFLLRD
jgi:hypothetical protein